MAMPLISADLQTAIEQLRPELPELLGTHHTTFATQLDAFLAEESENRIWDLFGIYPVVHERLLDILDQQEKAATPYNEAVKPDQRGLYGDTLMSLRRFICLQCKNERQAKFIYSTYDIGPDCICPFNEKHGKVEIYRRG